MSLLDNIDGFHIEATNICTLKCAGCPRTRFIDTWPGHWKNYSLDIDALMQFLDIDLTGKKITLCGHTGDPIYHPDLIRLVKEFKNQNAKIVIITNGSYKTQEWWEELVTVLDKNDVITFSIDGTPENFTEYRVNANWESIELGLKICAQAQCQTVWKYIPFAYNVQSIDQAQQLSKELGIDEFFVDPSDRFDEHTDYLKPTIELLGPRYNSQTKWKNNKSLAIVNPQCYNNRHHYISAEGFYVPCCYLSDYRFYYKNQFGKNKKEYDITKTTISDILQRPAVVEFYQNLDQHPGCQFNCPA